MENNYLVLEGNLDSTNNYKAKMLLNNKICGLLEVELRAIDDKDYIYYNITSKDTLTNIYENRQLDYITIKEILLDIIEIIEGSNQYLLDENSFILKPDYIYLNQSDSKARLCYYINYNESLLRQFTILLEYMMNKLDYKDEKAVLLVYDLYKLAGESNSTFLQLKKELNKSISITGNSPEKSNVLINEKEGLTNGNSNSNNNSGINDNSYLNHNSGINDDGYLNHNSNTNNTINSSYNKDKPSVSQLKDNYSTSPHYTEEIREEKEVLAYSIESYVIAIVSALAIVVIFIIMIKFKLLHNSFGTEIDLIKFLCFAVIMASLEALLINKIFNEDRKVSKIVSNVKEVGVSHNKIRGISSETIIEDTSSNITNHIYRNDDSSDHIESHKTQILWNDIGSEDNKTEILADLSTYKTTYYLQGTKQEKIYLDTSPFIIGKNTKGVNYTIKEESVSRFHGRINIDEEKIDITDLGSTNGTYVNGTRIKEQAPYNLYTNDEICLSKCKFLLKSTKI